MISINSQGTNKLIQDGAKLVLNAQDILDELNWFSLFDTKNVIDLNSYRNNRETFNDLDRDEQEVVELLLIESTSNRRDLQKLSINAIIT